MPVTLAEVPVIHHKRILNTIYIVAMDQDLRESFILHIITLMRLLRRINTCTQETNLRDDSTLSRQYGKFLFFFLFCLNIFC